MVLSLSCNLRVCGYGIPRLLNSFHNYGVRPMSFMDFCVDGFDI